MTQCTDRSTFKSARKSGRITPRATHNLAWKLLSSPRTGLAEIKSLEQKLNALPGVEQVRLIFKKPDDIYSIVFQIKPKLFALLNEEEENIEQPNSDEISNLWKKAQSLVLQTCRHLRNITGKKWYFRTQLVEDFGIQALDF